MKLFKFSNYLMALIFFLSASCLDGDGWIAEIMVFVSLVYGWVALAINEMNKEQGGED